MLFEASMMCSVASAGGDSLTSVRSALMPNCGRCTTTLPVVAHRPNGPATRGQSSDDQTASR